VKKIAGPWKKYVGKWIVILHNPSEHMPEDTPSYRMEPIYLLNMRIEQEDRQIKPHPVYEAICLDKNEGASYQRWYEIGGDFYEEYVPTEEDLKDSFRAVFEREENGAA
jgi:hypothetical protein